MGFFDKFSSNVELTPAISMTAAMIYMMASDGELAEEEMDYLFVTLRSFGEPRELIETASRYVKKNDLDTFLTQANKLLSEDQKLTLLANLIDMLLSDGNAEEEEQELFFKFAEAFGFSEEDMQPYIDILSVKNDFALFL